MTSALGFIFDSLGAGEVLLVLIAALLLFGAERLPALARMLGHALNEMRRAANELTHIITDDDGHSSSAQKNSEQQNQQANEERKREG